MKSDQGGHGHPIGVFLHHNDKLNKFDGIIEDGLWMLEIFIYDPVLNRLFLNELLDFILLELFSFLYPS